MIPTSLMLPNRSSKPRRQGLTVVIDNGAPLGVFKDAISSAKELIDLVKFGWGTALVTPRMREKTSHLRQCGIGYFFGGTLFEKFAEQGLIEEYMALCRQWGCDYMEISDGTVHMSSRTKSSSIERASRDFVVLSEVGYKDPARCESLTGNDWRSFIERDFDAGASFVVTEARESGRGGLCDAAGALRGDIVEEIIGSVDVRHLVFEAPTKELQTFFVTRIGSDANLANIALNDVIGVETLRLGLRSDTFLHFELEHRHQEEMAKSA
ncbi:MAG: phosphosulfolactate synthase [Acidimicrobiales bacterium]